MQVAAIVVLSLINLALVMRFWPRVRGSTLVGPWIWCLVALASVATAEVVIGLCGQPAWCQPLRYAAAMSTFCPAMAVLGAKRPQHRGWMWVVLTLWLVLSTPAIQAALFSSTGDVNPYLSWQILLFALLVIEWMNWVFSEHFWAATSVSGAHFMYTAAVVYDFGPNDAKFVLFQALILHIPLTISLIGIRSPLKFGDPLQQVWQRFTRAYGTLWTFRVMSLINQTAALENWPVRAMPRGFTTATSPHADADLRELSRDERRKIAQSLRNTLRRFVAHHELDMLETM